MNPSLGPPLHAQGLPQAGGDLVAKCEAAFSKQVLRTEDDVKIQTYSTILKPLFDCFAPSAHILKSEPVIAGSRPDGTIGSLVLEYKKPKHFVKEAGIRDALFGRRGPRPDSGLYQYLIDLANQSDDPVQALGQNIGVAFDGQTFIFARFVAGGPIPQRLSRKQIDANGHNPSFHIQKMSRRDGIAQIRLLANSTEKAMLTKENLARAIHPTAPVVKDAVSDLYNILIKQCKEQSPTRIKTLYDEWNSVFGAMFGEADHATEFNETSGALAAHYDVDDPVIFKPFLFAVQTYYNILLKLLIARFLEEIEAPSTETELNLSWSQIVGLFDNQNPETFTPTKVSNFFEVHFYEWFTYLGGPSDSAEVRRLVNDTGSVLGEFDFGTFAVRPEVVHDLLQELYMTLIPTEVRHLLGEYFSPDWIVDLGLERVGYTGEPGERIVDPTCGSGPFVVGALKKALERHENGIDEETARQLTNDIVGFDLNPISAVSAKANYILVLFSALKRGAAKLRAPLTIPIYIADSVLAPIVYSESNQDSLVAHTSLATPFTLPRFRSLTAANLFLDTLGSAIEKTQAFAVFWEKNHTACELADSQRDLVEALYEQMLLLHRSAQDAFWPRILKNSFAPVLIQDKFDFVVGNPPWISWKSMSKTYRDGTLTVWQSYGIFEKNAYDKKTTHDDFGMAVTYVALDQYLKEGGHLFFLLPWTFLKSTKGGEGFRKFRITRNGADTPIGVKHVDDFGDVRIFKPRHTVRTIGLLAVKGQETDFPFKSWKEWHYASGKAEDFDAHDRWVDVRASLAYRTLHARPVGAAESRSPWLTMPKQKLQLATRVLCGGGHPVSYRGRKGIEPAGAKGVYVLKEPVPTKSGTLIIENDMSRQRRQDLKSLGAHRGEVEPTFIYPMLGGRNIQRWQVVDCEYMVVPHTPDTPYGLAEGDLARSAPLTHSWLEFYKEGLLASRIQSGKFFDQDKHPWYRLDNVGDYTFSPYKVLWKEMANSFAAVAVGSYRQSVPGAQVALLGGTDKVLVVDSKVLMLAMDTMEEAHFVTGVLNSPTVREVIDSYAVGLNRGLDVLKYICVPKFDASDSDHQHVSQLAAAIQRDVRNGKLASKALQKREGVLDTAVAKLF